MSVKSLMELATMACIKNVKALEGIGDYLPYESVRHVLLKVEYAHQLRQIELNSPQIQGHTGELWIKLIEKDFPLEYKANAYKPSSPEKWYRVWEKYKKEHDAAIEASENKLKNALAGLKESKEKNTSKIVESKFLPRSGRVGPKRAQGPRDHTTSTLTFNAGCRTKTNTGASVMRKVRREVKEIANIQSSLSKVIRGPTRHTELKKAPAAMIGDYERAAKPQFRGAARPPSPLSALERHEQRATVISESEGDDDDDHRDDLFDDTRAPKAASPAKSTASDAAKISLLKKKPAAPRPQPNIKVQPAAVPKKQVNSSAPAKLPPSRGGSALAKKFQRAQARAVPVTNSSPPQAKSPPSAEKSPKGKGYLADVKGKPLPEALAAALLPPKDDDDEPEPEIKPQLIYRKRKAVDIFMRSKKRVV